MATINQSAVRRVTYVLDSLKNWSSKRLFLTGVSIIATSSAIGWYGFPELINYQIASKINLGKDSELRKMWANFPDPIGFKIYFFNVTNPMEIQKGDKPVLNEIGPYVYDEYKSKAELFDHDEDDSVSFNNRDTWYFNRMKSGSLTGDEIITIPHLLILGMALSTEKDMKPVMPVVAKAIPHIFRDPTSVFLTAPARDILFDGVLINCTIQDFAARALCNVMKAQGGFEKVGKSSFKFSFFGPKNGTLQERLRLKRGVKDVSEIGRIVSYKDQPRMTVYNSPKCNEYLGTDGSIFPPFLKDGPPVQAYAPDLCRSLNAVYKGKTVFKGVEGNIYSADFGDPMNDPDLRCFCTTPKTCLKRGVHDLTRCTGAPMVVSLPHFYLAHEDYVNDVRGLHPQKHLHETTLHFEPLTGTPMLGFKRLQFNIKMHKISNFKLMKNLPTVLFPILWVDEGLELEDKYMAQLQIIFTAFSVVNGIKWSMIAAGGSISGLGFYRVVQKMTNGAMSKMGRNSPEVAPEALDTPPRQRY